MFGCSMFPSGLVGPLFTGDGYGSRGGYGGAY